jgi:hypothetical protein
MLNRHRRPAELLDPDFDDPTEALEILQQYKIRNMDPADDDRDLFPKPKVNKNK